MRWPPLVIGIGNDYRGDDAIGLAVVRALRARKIERVRLMESDGDCTTLFEAWKQADMVILVDAVFSGAAPGTIHRVDTRTQALPEGCTFSSTHAIGIAEALRLARTLGQLPPCVIVYGIEGENFATGEDLSPSLKRVVQRVVERIMADIQRAS